MVDSRNVSMFVVTKVSEVKIVIKNGLTNLGLYALRMRAL